MTDSDKLRLEIARAALVKAACKFRDNLWEDKDQDMRDFFEAVDHYEDVEYAVTHKDEDDTGPALPPVDNRGQIPNFEDDESGEDYQARTGEPRGAGDDWAGRERGDFAE
jgi:hypothetical protein